MFIPFELELGLTFSSVKSGAGIIPIPLELLAIAFVLLEVALVIMPPLPPAPPAPAVLAEPPALAVLAMLEELTLLSVPPALALEADVELEATFVVSLGVSSPHATVDRPIQVPIKSAARVAECIRIW
jgi:hypothetical protein